MPAKKPKFDFLIMCDDIREEVGHKVSLMGIYQKDIFVPKFPFTFPKLCFVIHYADIKAGDSFLIELLDPSGKQLGNLIKGSTPKNIEGYAHFQMHAMYSPLIVEREGDYKLIIKMNDDEKTKHVKTFAIKQPKEKK